MSVDEVLKFARGVGGFLTDDEAKFLYLAAKKFAKKGPIVEIGSWKGKSTVCLAVASKEVGGNKIFAIDPHIGSREDKNSYTLPEFKRNIKKFSVDRYVNTLVMKSEDAARKWPKGKKIAFLWVDGSHEYEDVKKDFLVWKGLLMEGGLIAFHDSFYSGPSKVVNAFIIKQKGFSNIGHIDYITFATKGGAKGPRIRVLYSFYFRYFLRNLMRSGHLQPVFVQKMIKRVFLKKFKRLESIK